MYSQIVLFALDGQIRVYLPLVVAIVSYFELRSPNILVTDSGIILLFGIQERELTWNKISKVTFLNRVILVYDDVLPLPLFFQSWRSNYPEAKKILQEQFNKASVS
jgi:hypothetical protein